MQHHYRELKNRIQSADFSNKRGQPGPDIKTLIQQLEQDVCPLSNTLEDKRVVKSLVLLCEAHDYFGNFRKAEEHAKGGAAILDNLPNNRIFDKDFELVQAKVRLATAYARSLYRHSQLNEALAIAIRGREYVEQNLLAEAHPNFGTRGELSYLIGRILRQQQQLQQSTIEFNAAIDLYDRRRKYKSAPSDSIAARFSASKCATILALGTGWAHYSLGSLHRAIAENLIPARIILRQTGDTLNNAYADVIYASILRAIDGDKPTLTEARQLVTAALNTFLDHRHAHYAAGAYLELALIDLANRDLHEVTADVKKMQVQIKSMADEGYEDQRWACSAEIINSRLQRQSKHPAAAEGHASAALKIAENNKEPLGLIDARIARSEARFMYRDHSKDREALEDLHTAIRLNEARGVYSPKIEGSCRLHLAQYYMEQHKTSVAIEHFQKWELVANDVEHAMLHAKANVIKEGLPKLTHTLLIDASTTWNYKYHQAKLDEFLLKEAAKRASTKAGVAHLLGFNSRQAFDSHFRRRGRRGPRIADDDADA